MNHATPGEKSSILFCSVCPSLADWLHRGPLAPLLLSASAAAVDGDCGWDFILLGYIHDFWPVGRAILDTTVVHGVTLGRFTQHAHRRLHGSHCYLVSRTGLSRLLRVGKPFEMHMDFFLVMAAELGILRGYAVHPAPVATQCDRYGRPHRTPWLLMASGDIPHLSVHRTNWKLVLPPLGRSFRHPPRTDRDPRMRPSPPSCWSGWSCWSPWSA